MKKHLSAAGLLLCLICVFASGCQSGGASYRTVADIDLTRLSGTMVYAEVYHMMTSPLYYMGRTVKARGDYNVLYDDETGRFYHYIVIRDATGCCPQGLEFIWSGDRVYPDDYPKINTTIEFVGVFGSYEESGDTFYYLAVDDLVLGNL